MLERYGGQFQLLVNDVLRSGTSIYVLCIKQIPNVDTLNVLHAMRPIETTDRPFAMQQIGSLFTIPPPPPLLLR